MVDSSVILQTLNAMKRFLLIISGRGCDEGIRRFLRFPRLRVNVSGQQRIARLSRPTLRESSNEP